MNQRGKPEPGRDLYNPGNQQFSAPVFPGKPTTPNPHGKHNLAVQRSLMEIFDDFTDVISGELKSMNFEDAEQAFKKPESKSEVRKDQS